MDFFISIYQLFVYQPLLNALVFLYGVLGDFGLAVIVLTVLIRLVFFPLTAKAIRAQQKMAEIQPKIKELQEKMKHDKQEQSRAIFALYKQEKVNPFSGIFPLLVQLPIFIAFFQLFSGGFEQEQLAVLYPFVAKPDEIIPTFFGLINLSATSLPIALLTGGFQFLRGRQTAPKRSGATKRKKGGPDFSSMMQTQMVYVLPIIIAVVAYRLPSAFGLYLIAGSVIEMGQHWLIIRNTKSEAQKEEDEKRNTKHKLRSERTEIQERPQA